LVIRYCVSLGFAISTCRFQFLNLIPILVISFKRRKRGREVESSIIAVRFSKIGYLIVHWSNRLNMKNVLLLFVQFICLITLISRIPLNSLSWTKLIISTLSYYRLLLNITSFNFRFNVLAFVRMCSLLSCIF